MHAPWEMTLLDVGTPAMMSIIAPWITAPSTVMTLLSPQPVPQHHLLGRAERLVGVTAWPRARPGPVQVERIAVSLAPERRLAVNAVDGDGRLGRERGVDAVLVGVDEDGVFGKGDCGRDKAGDIGGGLGENDGGARGVGGGRSDLCTGEAGRS